MKILNKLLVLLVILTLFGCNSQKVTLPEQPSKPQGAIITEDNTIIFYHNIWGDIKRNLGMQ